MSKIYMEDRWVFNMVRNRFEYYRSCYIEDTANVDDIEPDITINRNKAHKLVKYMSNEGFLQRTVDEKVRSEDLKITHRHLDIIEKMVEKE